MGIKDVNCYCHCFKILLANLGRWTKLDVLSSVPVGICLSRLSLENWHWERFAYIQYRYTLWYPIIWVQWVSINICGHWVHCSFFLQDIFPWLLPSFFQGFGPFGSRLEREAIVSWEAKDWPRFEVPRCRPLQFWWIWTGWCSSGVWILPGLDWTHERFFW